VTQCNSLNSIKYLKSNSAHSGSHDKVKTELDILHEDNHLLVVNKPAVLATMGVKPEEPSLLNDCKAYLKKKYGKPGNVYLGVVSRLDSWVTGAIVFARTSKAASRLNQQFRERTVEKSYIAIVDGKPPAASGMLEDWVLKNDQRRRMEVTRAEAPGAKLAKLNYQLLDQIETGRGAGGAAKIQSLLSIELLTGRKHQIRVQLSHLGLPIVGDRKYESQTRFANGIALHAQMLAFDHPTSKTRLTFQCDPPNCWKIDRFTV